MATLFTVIGPLEIPVTKAKVGRYVDGDNGRDFWFKYPELAEQRGCYVFCVRTGRGITPAYVGRATRNRFRQEVFTPHKLNYYSQALTDYRRGTPVLFLLVPTAKRGAINAKCVSKLENFLIQTAVAVNPDLKNVQGTKAADWGVVGVIRGGKGKPSASARRFKNTMKIH